MGQIDESILEGEEFDKPELLRFEKEMLGSFVSDHPLLEVADDLRSQSTHEIGDLESADDGELVTVAGIIGVARKYTKRGEPYAQFRLEGLSAGVDVVAFPSVYEADPIRSPAIASCWWSDGSTGAAASSDPRERRARARPLGVGAVAGGRVGRDRLSRRRRARTRCCRRWRSSCDPGPARPPSASGSIRPTVSARWTWASSWSIRPD